MPSNYTGVPGNAVSPPVISEMVDGDAGNAASAQTPLQTLADNVAAALLALTGLIPGGRLTLTTGTPVTTADVTAVTTVYYTPYLHTQIPLYNGTTWQWFTFAEVSQTLADTTKSPAAAVASTCYDMFLWNDSGTIRCTRGWPWSAGGGSTTARGSGASSAALQQVNGRWTNQQAITNGPGANKGLYVGTIYVNGSTQANDAKAFRHVWNMYNRTRRAMRIVDATGSWSGAVSMRQARGQTTNVLDFVRGLDEDDIDATLTANYSASNTAASPFVSIGLDSNTAISSDCNGANWGITGTNTSALGQAAALTAQYNGYPGLGRHTLVWQEEGSGTFNFLGQNAGPTGSSGNITSGLNGACMA